MMILMSCNTNERPVDLPQSIVLATPTDPIIEEDDIQRELACEAADEDQQATVPPDVPSKLQEGEEPHPRLSVTMPSAHVVEISQTFYWPLYSKPIDWIYQEHITDTLGQEEIDDRCRRVAELLNTLEFSQSLAEDDAKSSSGANITEESESAKLSVEDATSEDESVLVASAPAGDIIARIMEELVEEKEDWFSDLSGGQRSKVELVRKVFLMDECPHVLLIDETMAPLDPRSKSLVMASIKDFCSGSVVIVIYHTDVGREQEAEEGSGELVECVPSNDFFDGNIHVENKMMHLRPVC